MIIKCEKYLLKMLNCYCKLCNIFICEMCVFFKCYRGYVIVDIVEEFER